MKKIRLIIKEEIYKFAKEGVADYYGEKFGLENPAKEMDKIAMKGMKSEDDSMGKFIGKTEEGGNVYLNPKNLFNFDADIRAISDMDGNLFVLQTNTKDYHKNIAQLLIEKGLTNLSYKSDVYDGDFITLHRIGKTNDFGVSISYIDYITNSNYNTNGDTPSKPERLFNAVQRKNPNFKFIPKYWENLK